MINKENKLENYILYFNIYYIKSFYQKEKYLSVSSRYLLGIKPKKSVQAFVTTSMMPLIQLQCASSFHLINKKKKKKQNFWFNIFTNWPQNRYTHTHTVMYAVCEWVCVLYINLQDQKPKKTRKFH